MVVNDPNEYKRMFLDSFKNVLNLYHIIYKSNSSLVKL